MTGGAWLSSARVVRCWVKSRNERNPFSYVTIIKLGTHAILPVTNWRKVGIRQVIMPLMGWASHVLQWAIQRVAIPRGGANLRKSFLVRIAVCNSTA